MNSCGLLMNLYVYIYTNAWWLIALKFPNIGYKANLCMLNMDFKLNLECKQYPMDFQMIEIGCYP